MKEIGIVSSISNKKDWLIENFTKLHIDYVLTSYPGHSALLAKQLSNQYPSLRLYLGGGDGTIHEVVNAIYDQPGVELVLMPLGTGNDFIKSLPGIKEDYLQIENFKDGSIIQADLIQVGDEVAINTVSLGFDVKVAKNMRRFTLNNRLKGTLPYNLSVIYCLFSGINTRFKMMVDSKKLENEDYSFVVFCSGGYYGGGYHPCPEAKVDDGIMDYCIIKPLRILDIAKLAGKYKQGKHVNYAHLVTIGQSNHIQILNEKPVEICLDGEIRTVLKPEITLLPKKIKIVVPSKVTV